MNWELVFVLLVCWKAQTVQAMFHNTSPSPDQYAFNTNILLLMRNFGMEKVKNTNTNQYLVVTMLTANEVLQSAKWTSEKIKKLAENPQRRVQFITNKQLQDALPETGTGTKHGEMLFLYHNINGPQKLSEMLPADGSKGLPHLIFFSYYIPCACVSGCRFSCAEELGELAKQYRNKYKVVVGYEDVYKMTFKDGGSIGTDKSAAESFLKEGGIDLYILTNQMFYTVNIQSPIQQNTHKVFQAILRDILIKSSVAVCTTENPIANDRKPIANSFINQITIPCFQDNKRGYAGGLSEHKKWYLDRCLLLMLEAFVGEDCNRMPKGQKVKYSFYTHIVDALKQSSQIGNPQDPEFSPIENNIAWHLLKTTNNEQNYLKCWYSQLSVKSFCTKKEKSAFNIPDVQRCKDHQFGCPLLEKEKNQNYRYRTKKTQNKNWGGKKKY